MMNQVDLNKLSGKNNSEAGKTSQDTWTTRLEKILNTDIQLSSGTAINDKFKEGFYSGLSLLLNEGIDLKTAFSIILEESEKEKVSAQLKEMQIKIINGERLADVIKQNPNFTAYEYHSIEIGEECGQLIEVMQEMSIYFQRKIKLKRQLSSALIYPAIVLMVAFGTIVFMLNFVVPMFSEIFKRFKGDLPYVTKLIISLSQGFKSYFGLILLGGVVLGFIYYFQRNKDRVRDYKSRIILSIPVLGELVRKIYLARFSQSLALLLKSKVSIIRSLEMVKNMVNFYPIEVSIEPIKEQILRGESLHNALANYPIYSKKMINMIKVAEDVNKLDEMLGRISVQFSEETEHQIELFNKLLEPVLIIFLGLIVGFILIAMYLPLFQLGTQIGT